jgi:hypothetical protein
MKDESSMKRIHVLSTVAAALAVPAAIFFGSVAVIERQRVADAEPAFAPIEHLRPHIFSQPVAFYRSCRYVVDFPPDSDLSDENVAILTSLNRLPSANILDVTIRTRAITDASIPVLETLETADLLDVTESGISDTGIESLRVKLAGHIVSRRSTSDLPTAHDIDN